MSRTLNALVRLAQFDVDERRRELKVIQEEEDRLILRLADSLHETSSVDDALWTALRDVFSEEQLIELVVLACYYHTISFCCRAFGLPLEPYAARFDAVT